MTARRSMGSILTVLLMGLARPDVALACPVCFTATDSPAANGMGMAILAMLGVTAAMLASFAAFFIYLMRRSRSVNGAAPAMARPIQHGGRN